MSLNSDFSGSNELFQKMYRTCQHMLIIALIIKNNYKWNWTVAHQDQFHKLKEIITDCNKNNVFNPKEDVYLFTDAIPYGVGIQLCNKDVNRKFKSIAWGSASLSPAERQYSHFEKEGLTLIFGIEKFNKYLYGRFFTVVTNSIPMKLIFEESKAIPSEINPRLVRGTLLIWL